MKIISWIDVRWLQYMHICIYSPLPLLLEYSDSFKNFIDIFSIVQLYNLYAFPFFSSIALLSIMS
jgi:hypothetical protein